MGHVPKIDQIDVTWLAQLLAINDATDLAITTVGHGQVANCYRLTLRRTGGSPVSVIAKVPSLDEVSRSTARLQHLYEREVSFYQHLASIVTTRTPECLFAERDDDDNFILILEDLSPSAPTDQFAGLSVEHAKSGLAELAGLHGPTHDRADLHAAPWLIGVRDELSPLYDAVLPLLFDQFIERYATHLSDDVSKMVRALKDRLALFTNYATPHPCVTHGDFRTDNLLIDAQGGVVPLAVVDWQTVGVASPLLDVAYFLTTSLSPHDCADLEDELLAFYLARLAGEDVVIPLDLARHEFARYTLQPIVMLVAASVIVEQTARGDEMFLAMIERGVVAATRWRGIEELERHAAS
jgi:hypothetical protein